ncbi:MAG TPA: cytochrome c oxidase subunit 3 [Gaiellaceae bacterium]
MSGYAAPRRGAPAGWWGMAMLIASEATLFGVLFGTYAYLRFRAAEWPPAGIPEPEVLVPAVLTVVLLATSIPMQLALRAGRAGRVAAARWLVLGALVVQAGYFAMQIHQYLADLSRFTPQDQAYGSIYFVLVGADHAHVALGLLFSVWLLAKLLGGLTRYRLNALLAITLYWHFVNVLTLLVFLVQVSPAL